MRAKGVSRRSSSWLCIGAHRLLPSAKAGLGHNRIAIAKASVLRSRHCFAETHLNEAVLELGDLAEGIDRLVREQVSRGLMVGERQINLAALHAVITAGEGVDVATALRAAAGGPPGLLRGGHRAGAFGAPRKSLHAGPEELVAYLARSMDRTAITKLIGVHWHTVGAIIHRVVDERLSDERLSGLRVIGIDEFSYRNRSCATRRCGHGSGSLKALFKQLGEAGCAGIESITMDMVAGYIRAVSKNLSGESEGRRPGNAPGPPLRLTRTAGPTSE